MNLGMMGVGVACFAAALATRIYGRRGYFHCPRCKERIDFDRSKDYVICPSCGQRPKTILGGFDGLGPEREAMKLRSDAVGIIWLLILLGIALIIAAFFR